MSLPSSSPVVFIPFRKAHLPQKFTRKLDSAPCRVTETSAEHACTGTSLDAGMPSESPDVRVAPCFKGAQMRLDVA